MAHQRAQSVLILVETMGIYFDRLFALRSSKEFRHRRGTKLNVLIFAMFNFQPRLYQTFLTFLLICISPKLQAAESSVFLDDPSTFSQLPELNQLAREYLNTGEVYGVPFVTNVGARYNFSSPSRIPEMTGMTLVTPGQVGYSTAIMFVSKDDLTRPGHYIAAVLFWPDRMRALFSQGNFELREDGRYVMTVVNPHTNESVLIQGNSSQVMNSANLAALIYQGQEFMFPTDRKPALPLSRSRRCELLFLNQ